MQSLLRKAIDEIQYSNLSCVGATKRCFFFSIAIDGDKGGGGGRTCGGTCNAFFVFIYASRRLYIAHEAREGTISISFDKNKHCRGTARAGPASVTKTRPYEIHRYPRVP